MKLPHMLSLLLPTAVRSIVAPASQPRGPMKVVVFGGTGYVGSAVCERLVKRGHEVTAVSRRGNNPKPDSPELSRVNWVQGDATDLSVVESLIKNADASVHAIGLLFDVESGLANLNKIVSGSGSVPGNLSTYDAITRTTAFNVINSIEKKQSRDIGVQVSRLTASNGNLDKRFPLCFVSAAEAGWPDVPFGETVDRLAPEWLNKYLVAKRAVENRLKESDLKNGMIRSVIFRPSLIWDWTKLDVLPVIPIFNFASAIGIPFVDKTVRVESLADAIVAGLEGDDVQGVQRFSEIKKLSIRI